MDHCHLLRTRHLMVDVTVPRCASSTKRAINIYYGLKKWLRSERQPLLQWTEMELPSFPTNGTQSFSYQQLQGRGHAWPNIPVRFRQAGNAWEQQLIRPVISTNTTLLKKIAAVHRNMLKYVNSTLFIWFVWNRRTKTVKQKTRWT